MSPVAVAIITSTYAQGPILGCNVVAAPLMVVAVLVDDRTTAIYLSAVVVALFMVRRCKLNR